MIPLFDLKAQYLTIKTEIDQALLDVVVTGNFIKGTPVKEFERSFAEYLEMKYCLGVGNGTDALEIILKALEIGPGDEVLVPALSWISTAEAVNSVGAEPVFVDIEPLTYSIDPEKILNKISKKTKAIIPVHLYGHPSMMDRIMEISEEMNLYVIEDCAQSHGARIHDSYTGTFGIASAFSFFPTKNLGAYGDAGAIVTNDNYLFERICRIANHGQMGTKHEHRILGRNSRLDSLQAAILNVKLKYLEHWTEKRIEIASWYNRLLRGISHIETPVCLPGCRHVFHLYVIQTADRDVLINNLNNEGISAAIHYPRPLPFVEAYKYKGHRRDDFPVADDVCKRIISLPVFPEIAMDSVENICQIVINNIPEL